MSGVSVGDQARCCMTALRLCRSVDMGRMSRQAIVMLCAYLRMNFS